MKYDVFISYSTCDQKVADDICDYLEKNGIKCFIASRDIPAGVAFADYIVKALKESSMMVVVCSKNANVSEHIPREVVLISNEKKHILPFFIEDVPLEGNLQYYLVLTNRVDAFPKPEEHFERLCQNVRTLLGIKKIMSLPMLWSNSGWVIEMSMVYLMSMVCLKNWNRLLSGSVNLLHRITLLHNTV